MRHSKLQSVVPFLSLLPEKMRGICSLLARYCYFCKMQCKLSDERCDFKTISLAERRQYTENGQHDCLLAGGPALKYRPSGWLPDSYLLYCLCTCGRISLVISFLFLAFGIRKFRNRRTVQNCDVVQVSQMER